MVLRDVIGNYRKLIHFIIGLVHGMTNMGGGFLSIFSSLININKETTRKCVAHGYLLMGTFQYALLLVFFKDKLDFSRIYFAIISIFVYFSGNYFFKKISDKKFSKIIGLIVLIYGICILFVQLIN